MGRARRALLLGVVAGLAACQVKPEKCGTIEYLADPPLERVGARLYTHMRINGQDARVILDTGGIITWITAPAAIRSHVRPNGKFVNLAYIGGSFLAPLVTAGDVGLGAATGEDLTFALVPDEVAAVMLGGPSHAATAVPADGMLALDVLRDIDVDLDLWGGKMGLYAQPAGCQQIFPGLADPIYGVPLRNSAISSHVIVDVTLNGHVLRAFIDTGAPQSAIFAKAAARVGLPSVPGLPVAGEPSLGPGPRRNAPSVPSVSPVFNLPALGAAPVKAEIVISPPVEIGALTIKRLPLVVVQYDAGDEADMILGLDFVSRVHLLISHSLHGLLMQYPPRATIPVLPGKNL